MTADELARRDRMLELQSKAEAALKSFAAPGYAFLVVITEVDRPTRYTFKAMVSLGLAGRSVKDLLRSALRMATPAPTRHDA